MIQLHTDEELTAAFPLMRQLRPHLKDAADFIARVREGEKREDYALFALEENSEYAALCGAQPMFTLYYDHCLWICDLVTDESSRSRGHGARLLGEVETWARAAGYREISLSSGVQRTDAHRFYLEKMHYALASYAFRKKL